MKIYIALCRLFIAVLFAAIPLHFILLASDSETYRGWVYVQMCVLSLAEISLWLSLRPNWFAACVFSVLIIPAAYINAVYLNYGNGPVVWLAPTIFLLGFLAITINARKEFVENA